MKKSTKEYLVRCFDFYKNHLDSWITATGSNLYR